MTTGQQKTIRFWEDRNCFGGLAYAEVVIDDNHNVVFVFDATLHSIYRSMNHVLYEIRRFYGKRNTNN